MKIEKDGEEAKLKQNKYYEDRMREMKKVKHELKQQQVEDEKKHFDVWLLFSTRVLVAQGCVVAE